MPMRVSEHLLARRSPTAPPSAETADMPQVTSRRSAIAAVFLGNRLAVAGVILVVLMAAFCFLGPLLYKTNQIQTDITQANLPPGGSHPLGTDPVGYDILGRLMLGGQSSLELGISVALLGTLFGALYGAVSGYCGGVVDAIMMRIVDVLLALPTLVIVLVLSAIFRPTLGLLILILAFFSWLAPARLIRGECLSLRSREYVQAVRGQGGGSVRIVLRHLIPNSIGTIIVNATFQIADAILILATLSFFGLGLPPPAATWGGMLSDGLNYIFNGYWWIVYPAGLAIVITVVAFNLIGDALRDSLDVRLQQR